MSGEQFAAFVRGRSLPGRRGAPSRPAGFDPRRLNEVGWCALFGGESTDGGESSDEVREALAPLLELRRSQAGERFREYRSREQLLAAKDVPYYILIVGSASDIPYDLQAKLGLEYAVGRISFHSVEEYAQYAQSVVAAESGRLRLAREVAFFGPVNAKDPVTEAYSRLLVTPLVERFRDTTGWIVGATVGGEASKAQLSRLLGGEQTPALLVTASHGLEFPLDNPLRIEQQGAIVCSDWAGPEARSISRDAYFSAADLSGDSRLQGLVSFHFGSYTAGTPVMEEFARQGFPGGLPGSLLGCPTGAALATIGYVGRVWAYSFDWPGLVAQRLLLDRALATILDGYPVGAAIEDFKAKSIALAMDDPDEATGLWMVYNDALACSVAGDPAARLAVVQEGETPTERTAGRSRPLAAPRMTPSESFSVVTSEPSSEVFFTARHPRTIGAEWRKLLVYAHIKSAAEAIGRDSGQILGRDADNYREADAAAPASIAPGTEITIVPEGRGLEFKPPSRAITWSGEWQRADFEMRSTGDRSGHVVEGSISCYVGPLLVASLRMPLVAIEVGQPEANGDPDTSHTAQMYHSVFASYSHADTAVVEAVEKAYKALGMDYLRDVMTLRSGQKWSDELLKMIDQADIFQLFWSANSSQSPYVEQEWRHALTIANRKGGGFIRPVWWESPLPRVPEALSSIHFAHVDLTESTGRDVIEKVTIDDSLTTITVSTWRVPDPALPEKRDLKAWTRVSLNGDSESWSVPDLTAEDATLHGQTVSSAVSARLTYLQLLGGDRKTDA